MTCPHCGASVHESVQRCPYCDSFLEPEMKPESSSQNPNTQRQEQLRRTFRMNGPDEPQAMFIVLALLIPIFGFIIGAIHMSGGKPKCGKTYIILSAVSFVVFFCGSSMLPFLLSAFSFSKMS